MSRNTKLQQQLADLANTHGPFKVLSAFSAALRLNPATATVAEQIEEVVIYQKMQQAAEIAPQEV